MKVKELKSEGLTHELEITVPANDIDARLDVKLQEVGKTVRIPGFRPGKVPLKMLKERYGKAILGEVLEAAVNETSSEAMDKQKIKPAMQPKIEVKSKDFGDGNDLVYTLAVDVLPDFKVADFKKAKLTKPVAKAVDADIEDALKRIAANNVGTKKIEGDRKTKDGDTVLMDFDGRTADDDVHHDGMKSEGFKLKLGSGQFIPGFEEQLVGKKAGDDVAVKVSFPEQYQAAELAGREAIFDVKIHEIHEETEAQIDEDFAKTLGMDSVDALKKAVGEQLENEYEGQSRMALKKDLLDFLDDAHDFEIPPTMLEMENQNILDQIKLDRQRNGESEDLTKAEEKEFKEIAERRVRLGLILSQVGTDQNITVADPELQQAVIREAQKYPGQEKEVFDYYSKNRNAVESLRAPLFEDKVVDYILELADVSEKEVTADVLANILEEDDDASDKKEAKKEEKPKKKAAPKKSAAKKKPEDKEKSDDKK
ncbi:MAG: trigger factor [Bdellovibrionales bacterium]